MAFGVQLFNLSSFRGKSNVFSMGLVPLSGNTSCQFFVDAGVDNAGAFVISGGNISLPLIAITRSLGLGDRVVITSQPYFFGNSSTPNKVAFKIYYSNPGINPSNSLNPPNNSGWAEWYSFEAVGCASERFQPTLKISNYSVLKAVYIQQGFNGPQIGGQNLIPNGDFESTATSFVAYNPGNHGVDMSPFIDAGLRNTSHYLNVTVTAQSGNLASDNFGISSNYPMMLSPSALYLFHLSPPLLLSFSSMLPLFLFVPFSFLSHSSSSHAPSFFPSFTPSPRPLFTFPFPFSDFSFP